jgi:hypothetical protein
MFVEFFRAEGFTAVYTVLLAQLITTVTQAIRKVL